MSQARHIRGTTTVEFAIVGALFFTVLLGVIEFGRALYTWNTLSEVARRGARVAAVCPLGHSAIARVALISEPGAAGGSPFVRGLMPQHIEVRYLDEDGVTIADPVTDYADIRFVRVAVSGFQYQSLIPFLGIDQIFESPGFAATIPRESLGVPRDGDNAICFGTQS